MASASTAQTPTATSSPTASVSSGGNSTVKKRSSIERPRPLLLKTTSSSSNRTLSTFELSSVENTLSLLENVAHNLSSGNYDYPTVTTAIINLSASLKSWGPQLEVLYKEQVDKCQIVLRNAARDEKLEMKSRLHLLEIIELRAMNWKGNESLTNYYKQKLALLENNGRGDYCGNYLLSGSSSAPILCSGAPPLFPSVAPGSKDRLVQITGPGEVNIEQAKALMEDTIKRNQSPTKEMSATIPTTTAENTGKQAEYKYTINVGGSKSLKISGANLDVIKTAKIVLEEYFEEANHPNNNNNNVNNNKKKDDKRRTSGDSKVGVIRTPLFPSASKAAFDDAVERKDIKDRRACFAKTNEMKRINRTDVGSSKSVPIIKYDRKSLYEMADSSLSKTIPYNWDAIIEMFPDIARKVGHEKLPLPVDWEANFLFTKKSQYSQHCDRRSASSSPQLTTRFGHNSRA